MQDADGGEGGSDGGERPSAKGLRGHAPWKAVSLTTAWPAGGEAAWWWTQRQGLMDDSQRAERRAGHICQAMGAVHAHPPHTSISRSQSAGTASLRTSGWNRDTPSEQVAVGPGFRRGECLLLSRFAFSNLVFCSIGSQRNFLAFLKMPNVAT